MDVSYFKGKKITVLGLGLLGGGLGVVKFLVKHGARVIVTDMKSKEQLAFSLKKLEGIKNIEYVLGHHRPEDFTKVDMVVKNPAVAWDNKYIKMALDKKIPVEMDSSLFFQLCKNTIIGVTGTKGKTTIASMIFDLLKLVGKNAITVGIGTASVLDKIEELKKDSVVVFELSSWRLSALSRIKKSPHIAVMKNILPDHLNYYKTMKEYIEDKKNIFAFQGPKDCLIVNDDDEKVQEIIKESKARIFSFSENSIKKNYSVFLENGYIYLNNGIDVRKLVALEGIKIIGRHSIINAMAAIAAVYAFGVKISEIKEAVVKLKGIAHRMEFIREVSGVRYYNDTAATIPQAAISAINSFDKKEIILIAGGSDKNLDFAEFAKEIVDYSKGIIFLKGNATEKLILEIRKNLPAEDKSKQFIIVDSMDKAVEFASRSAEKGDVVILSPGAASFGLFANEFERGDKFRKAVNDLKER
ncbi:MAG: UDP-N-acetylmuramoyl-L-alanine--D-glutamate ligase [Candidatus Moranbacteria bacterium]|jgi:UDP-N-acetylmuramoylalanine--D-glutamate ligase|nr:UDP-N-acetylmuramoyl-L-alanine--D-glutamate ligase [Candidatus Moranbacteria bacterium]